ncbi:MAG: SpoIIE family protein phosphatase [Oscillospiraceae bacterium]|nr:SpoIIE family protein phosphatase [Oscillospiraceae bacterium]
MMTTIETYVRRSSGRLRKLAVNPRLRLTGKTALYFSAGLVLSAASLAHSAQPLALGLLFALTGWQGLVAALGGAAGYLLFWGKAGFQGLVWLGLGLPAALMVNRRKDEERAHILLAGAVAGLLVSAVGLGFQIFLKDRTAVPVYLLRVGLAPLSAWLFLMIRARKDPVADWLGAGVLVLSLAQLSLGPKLSLGFPAAGMLTAGGVFPVAALAGLALDLAQLTQVPMTAVLCLAWLCRLIPWKSKMLGIVAPGGVYLLVMGLCGLTDPLPAVLLAVGGGLAVLLPPQPELHHRRGETGLAQVRLELMAGVMSQTQQLLLEEATAPIDESALLARTQERACGGCPCRKGCRERLTPLPTNLLHKPLVDQFSLNLGCKKPARLVLELRRSQEQLRTIKADRDRREEYRWAVIQQYQFLAHYLQLQSDELPRRGETLKKKFEAQIGISAIGREEANGDRCLRFPGTGGRQYLLICDGMGTGLGAAQEGQTAAAMLRQMLSAGFPAEYALRSVNSLLVLRGRSASVTMDLAELRLDTGRVWLYKWGAAPSWLVRDGIPEKIGTAGPPPGLSVQDGRESVERLSLGRGEVLILTSDGVDGEAALRHVSDISAVPPGELADRLLELGCGELQDDATVAVVRLHPCALST